MATTLPKLAQLRAPTPDLLQPVALPDDTEAQLKAVAPLVRPLSQPPAVTLTRDPLEQQEGRAQNRLQRLEWQQDNPWGTAQNHPGTWGKIAHALSVAGNIAGNIVAPGTMAMIPGTQLNRRMQEQDLEGDIAGIEKQKSAQAEQAAQTEEARARVPLTQAQAAQAQAQADLIKQGKGWKVEFSPGGEPLQVTNGMQSFLPGQEGIPVQAQAVLDAAHKNYQQTQQLATERQQKPLSQEQADALNKTWDKIAGDYHLPTGQFRAGMPSADAAQIAGAFNNVISRGQGGEKIVIQQAAQQAAATKARDSKTESEYTWTRNKWDKDLATYNAQNEKLSEALNMVGKNAFGDAIGSIKSLSGLASGAGSGVRITGAELNAMTHARGYGGDFDAWLQKFGSGNNLTREQEAQLKTILGDVQKIAAKKQFVINQVLDDLGNAESTKDIRRIDSQARHALMGGAQ